MFARNLGALALCLASATTAHAATVTVEFSGSITEIASEVNSPLSIGDAISLSFVLDTDDPGAPGAVSSTRYVPTFASFTAGGLTETAVGSSFRDFGIANDSHPYGDSIDATFAFTGLVGAAYLNLIGSSRSVFSDQSLTTALNELRTNGLSGFGVANGMFYLSDGGSNLGRCESTNFFACLSEYSIDAVSVTPDMAPVPLPASLGFLGIGLAGLAAVARRRRFTS